MKKSFIVGCLLFFFVAAFAQTMQGYFVDDNNNSLQLSNLGTIRINNKEDGVVYRGDYSLSSEAEPGGTYRIYFEIDGMGSGQADLVWPLNDGPSVYIDGRVFYAR